jgi:lactate permease
VSSGTTTVARVAVSTRRSARSTVMAVAPYLVIIAVFSLSQLPSIKPWLAAHGTLAFHWPGLDVVDAVGKPIGAQTFKLDHIKATGTLLLLSGLIVMGVYRISPRVALRAYRDTLVQLRFTIVTVASVLALAFVMNLSGQTQSLGFALASAGGLFALLSPLIGWIGVAITGSDTSSNSLFGLMQATAANHAGLQPVLMAAANSSAGVLGKMLSPQNLAVAAAAVGMVGREGDIFRRLIWWSLGMLAAFTVLVYLQSTVLGWMVP